MGYSNNMFEEYPVYISCFYDLLCIILSLKIFNLWNVYVCMYVNKDVIILQVAVQATPCVDWELHAPAHGALNCLPGEKGLQCIATCSPGFR